MKNLIQSILILIAVLMATTGAQEVVIYAQVGGTVTLTQPRTTEPISYVNWKLDGHVLAWHNHLGGKKIVDELPKDWKDRLSLTSDSLIISNIQPEHFRTVVCEIKSNTVITTMTYKVLKLSVSLSPDSPVLAGEYMTLACDADTTQGHKPQIYWLDPEGTKHDRGENLKVKVIDKHNGQWTCVITYNNKESKTKLSVTVIDLSPAPSHPQYTSKSWPLTIPCSLLPHISWKEIEAKGGQNVIWHFSPKQASSSKTIFSISVKGLLNGTVTQQSQLTLAPNLNKGNLSLIGNRGVEKEGGKYVCNLEFKNSVTLKRTIHVEVLEITSPRTEFISGQQVNLTCGTGHALPSDVQLKWFPPQSSSLKSSDQLPANLIIPRVGAGDGGKWRCELWQNNIRLTSATITLKIEPRLSVWMLVTICGTTVIVILICVLVLIIYRRRQRKMRRLRLRVCQCKNPQPKGFYRT